MSEKHVDSVKKLSKEELGKSRKLVLDAINKKAILPKETKQHTENLTSDAPKAVDAIKEPFKKNKIINKIIKKQTPVVSEPTAKLSEDEKKKAREELNKIIPGKEGSIKQSGQKEEVLEKKIVGKPKEEIKLTPKEPAIKLSDEKKKKWREDLDKELTMKPDKEPDEKPDKKFKPIDQPKQALARKDESKKIATDFLHSSESQDIRGKHKKEKPKFKKIFDIRAKQKPDIAPATKEEPKKIVSKINPFNNELVADRIKNQETKEQPKSKAVIISKKEKAKLIKAKKKKEKKIKAALKQKKKQEKKRKKETKAIQKATKQRQREIARKEYKEKMIKARAWLHQSVITISKNLLNAYKRVLVLGLFGAAAALLIYASLLIIIIEYNIDNKVTRHIARFIPIPAYVSKQGLVNYYTYRDIRSRLELSGLNNEELIKATKVAVVEKIIIDSLARRYGLAEKSNYNNQSDILTLLNQRIVFDADINQVGIKRIRKIKELIDQSNDFVKVANKYGDDQDQITLGASDKGEYEYYEKVSSLNVGDISQIITISDGYYLFRCFDKKNDKLYLGYVHVAAKTLSEYIEESIMDYKLWSLVD